MSKSVRPSSHRSLRTIIITLTAAAILLTVSVGAEASGTGFIDSVTQFLGLDEMNTTVSEQPYAATVQSFSPDVELMMLPLDPALLTWNTFGNVGTETTEPSTTND